MVSVPLHNIFLRSLHHVQKDMMGSPEYRGSLQKLRRDLTEGERFSLDTKAVWEIVDRADLDVKHLMDRVQLARLPYTKIWLEYSQRDKIEANYYAGRGPKPTPDVPNLVGFLMERPDPENGEEWIATRVTAFSEDQEGDGLYKDVHGVSFFRYVFSAQSRHPIVSLGGARTILKDDPFRISDTEIALSLFGMMALQPENDPLQEARNKASMAIHPLWKQRLDAAIKNDPTRRDAVVERFREAISIEMNELRGEFRFLITALAVMNEVPIIVSGDVRPPRMSFVAGGRMQSYLTHRTVTINVPAIKQKQKTVSEILYEAGSKKRRHKVREHKRVYLNKDGSVRKTIWVPQHERGDAGLGYVTHDYAVTSRGKQITRREK